MKQSRTVINFQTKVQTKKNTLRARSDGSVILFSLVHRSPHCTGCDKKLQWVGQETTRPPPASGKFKRFLTSDKPWCCLSQGCYLPLSGLRPGLWPVMNLRGFAPARFHTGQFISNRKTNNAFPSSCFRFSLLWLWWCAGLEETHGVPNEKRTPLQDFTVQRLNTFTPHYEQRLYGASKWFASGRENNDVDST